MKKFSLPLSLVLMLQGASVVTVLTPTLWAGHSHTDNYQDEETATECPVCLEPYTPESIIIQFDCNQPTNHHYCLSCASHLKQCALCRHERFKVHDPRVRKDSYTYVHHRQKPLSAAEQQQLRTYLSQFKRDRISLKAAPDTIKRHCADCNHEVSTENIIIESDCGHNLCMKDALRAVNGKKPQCPTCKKGSLTIIDPLQKNERDQIVLSYLQRTPTKEETDQLKRIRATARLFQEHIPAAKRVTIATKPVPQRPETPRNNAPFTPSFSTPEIPEVFLKDLTPEEYQKNFGGKQQERQDLRIVPGRYPLVELNDDDISLNKHLPKHLNPRDWQVVIVETRDGKGEELGRMKREKPISDYPKPLITLPSIKGSFTLPIPPTDFFKGKSGDILAGLCVGLLVGQEYHKPDRFTPKASWLLYGAAAGGAYTLVRKANPQRPLKPKHVARWAAGMGAGIAAHALLGS
jgi:hypothetical protein